VEPIGLYDARFEYPDDHETSSDDDGYDGAANNNDYEYDSTNSLDTGTSDEDTDDDDAAAAADEQVVDPEKAEKARIVQQTTKVFHESPPGTKLQTIVNAVRSALNITPSTTSSEAAYALSYALVAQQVVFLMERQERDQRRGRQGGRPAAVAKRAKANGVSTNK
jgi:hypothetical protein